MGEAPIALRHLGVLAECGRRHVDGDGMVIDVPVDLPVRQWLKDALVVVDG
jgi:hypothetical protein